MAEGWAKALKGDKHRFYSAGIATHGLNPNAIKVMAEAGVDISTHTSDHASDLDVEFDVVFSVCGHAREHCPVFSHAPRLLHVGFDDPPALAKKATTDEEVLNHYRRVRDEIRHFIETLETHLEPECSASNAGLICR